MHAIQADHFITNTYLEITQPEELPLDPELVRLKKHYFGLNLKSLVSISELFTFQESLMNVSSHLRDLPAYQELMENTELFAIKLFETQNSLLMNPLHSFEFSGARFLKQYTRGKESCALHALLGDKINGIYCYPGENCDFQVKKYFVSELKTSLYAPDQETRSLFIRVIWNYFWENQKEGGGSIEARLLFSQTDQGRQFQEKLLRLHKQHEETMLAIKIKIAVTWLNLAQKKGSLRKSILSVATKLQPDENEIWLSILAKPISILDIIEPKIGDFLIHLNAAEGKNILNLKQRLYETQLEKENAQKKIILSKECIDHYINTLLLPLFFPNMNEIQLGAQIFYKNVIVFGSVGLVLKIDDENFKDLVVIYQQGTHFCRCIQEKENCENKMKDYSETFELNNLKLCEVFISGTTSSQQYVLETALPDVIAEFFQQDILSQLPHSMDTEQKLPRPSLSDKYFIKAVKLHFYNDTHTKEALFEIFHKIRDLNSQSHIPFVPLLTLLASHFEEEKLQNFMKEAADCNPYITYALVVCYAKLSQSFSNNPFFRNYDAIKVLTTLQKVYPQDLALEAWLKGLASGLQKVSLDLSSAIKPLEEALTSLALGFSQMAVEILANVKNLLPGYKFLHRYYALSWIFNEKFKVAKKIMEQVSLLPDLYSKDDPQTITSEIFNLFNPIMGKQAEVTEFDSVNDPLDNLIKANTPPFEVEYVIRFFKQFTSLLKLNPQEIPFFFFGIKNLSSKTYAIEDVSKILEPLSNLLSVLVSMCYQMGNLDPWIKEHTKRKENSEWMSVVGSPPSESAFPFFQFLENGTLTQKSLHSLVTCSTIETYRQFQKYSFNASSVTGPIG